eukprot:scaffold823_cov397-Prasinococcus_capsulatus_cf.AAC.23
MRAGSGRSVGHAPQQCQRTRRGGQQGPPRLLVPRQQASGAPTTTAATAHHHHHHHHQQQQQEQQGEPGQPAATPRAASAGALEARSASSNGACARLPRAPTNLAPAAAPAAAAAAAALTAAASHLGRAPLLPLRRAGESLVVQAG